MLLHAKPDGFLATESAVRVNGFDLSFGSVVSTTSTTTLGHSMPENATGSVAGRVPGMYGKSAPTLPPATPPSTAPTPREPACPAAPSPWMFP